MNNQELILFISSIVGIPLSIGLLVRLFNPPRFIHLLLGLILISTISVVIQSLYKDASHFLIILSYSWFYLFVFLQAKLIAYLFKVSTRLWLYIPNIILSLALSALFYVGFDPPFWLMSLPVAVGVVIPVLDAASQGIRQWHHLPAPHKALLIFSILHMLQALTFPWLRINESALIFAIAAGACLTLMFVFLASMIELKRTIEERTREQELNTIRSQFFANISHEIRTPLALLLGPLEKLGEVPELKDLPRARAYLQTAETNGNRLMQLINQLLDTSQLDAGEMKLSIRSYDIVPVLHNLVEAFRVVADEQHITLTFRTEAPALHCYCDLDKLQKIVYNLVSNALKFSPPHSKVRVTVSDAQPANAAYPEGYVQLTVNDTGIGIATEDLPYIFDRFKQVDASSRKAYPGTGLGLALVKDLVALHKGDVRVESEERIGSTFIVDLPLGHGHFNENDIALDEPADGTTPLSLEVPHPAAPLVAESSTEINPDAETLLIVEDHHEMRAFIRDCIEGSYQIIEAENGETGLAQARAIIPDLIITDLFMPVIDGDELCRRIREDTALQHIPLLILTARASDERRIRSLNLGADAYLTKPFHAHELNVHIRTLIDNRNKVREQILESGLLRADRPPVAAHKATSPFLARAMDVVTERLNEVHFNVDAFAESMHMSRRQLERLIQQHANISPNRFIILMRLKTAARRLQHDSDLVKSIALDVGFKNESHFATRFKEVYGVTPSEYARSTS